MSLDDRLRGAYQRQLDDVRRRTELPTLERSPEPTGPPLSLRLAVVAALVMVIGAGVVAVTRAVGDRAGVEAEPAAVGDDGASQGDATPQVDPPAEPSPTAPTPPEPSGSTSVSDDERAAGPEPTSDDEESTAADGSDAPTTAGPGSSSTQPRPDAHSGVANDVCPTGARAELERAALAYVGPNQGWGRKDDLVDEQDGPFYFETWEPGYELPVQVEVALAEPVLATDIRVAQDPFTPVSGTITIAVADQTVGIELSGVDGWRTHTFDQPTLLDRFTISRDNAEANITEVLVCVAAEPDS